ncbi:MAG: family 1 glycosylhydrolase, partial [bacterium]|nr:family 1 glycosylhydrolase [bacterium]
ITENGVADALDVLRPEFLNNNLRYLGEAIAEGADVRGYFHWSLVDNSELHEGLSKKFGLYDLDGKPRPSAYIYRDIIRAMDF